MTTILVVRDGKSISSFQAEGHSGYGEAGYDIVCASVSAVIWNTINGLLEVAGIPVTYEMQDGYVACDIPALSPTERKQADILLESMVLFFKNLAAQYSEFVKLTEV